jgi:hypothetical protein
MIGLRASFVQEAMDSMNATEQIEHALGATHRIGENIFSACRRHHELARSSHSSAFIASISLVVHLDMLCN